MEQLKCLLDVSLTGSLSSTAKRMFITQQAVSKAIRQLEEELGVTILIRTKQGVIFTEDGEDVIRFARKVVEEQETLKQHFGSKRQSNLVDENRMIHIGTTSSIANAILPNIISDLISQMSLPKIQLSAFDSFDSLLEQIDTGQCDIGLTIGRHQTLLGKIDTYLETLQMEKLLQDEFVVVMNKRFYDGISTTIDSEQYQNAIVRTNYDILAMDHTWSAQREKANIICSNDAEFHRRMMDKTGAMTMMSGLGYRLYFSNKKYVALPFENNAFPLTHAVIYRKDDDEQVCKFVSMIRREMYMK